MVLRPVNPSDVFSVQGVYPGFRPAALPAVPGLEGLAVVEAHGEGAGKIAKGTRVVTIWPTWPASSGNGTWQQYICVPEDILVTVPDGLADEVAAQFLVNPVTVVGMVEVLQIPKGEWLIQDGAGSVLGRQMIQYAKLKGLKTINVVRRQEQAQELLDLGADAVICSSTENVAERAKEITGGKGAYAGTDAVAGEMLSQIICSVRRKGTILNYGAMSGITFTASVADILFGLKTLTGFWLPQWLATLSQEKVHAIAQEVLQLLKEGKLTPYSGKTFALEDAKAAIAHATKDARGGKVFLKG
ncbi:hypothetical protein WJX84_011779 [Apatococcus fuscideae]|uniref:Enoyl reductase (ER) domain-containing protein n=1 Tax=Apatococcus fuscideae TaxID=2026836 RepID=A0AAW1T3J1_9CHLO